jgi:hypothetical protein
MKKMGLKLIFCVSLLGLIAAILYSVYICILPIPGEHSYMGAKWYILIHYWYVWLLAIVSGFVVVFSYDTLGNMEREEIMKEIESAREKK